MKAKQLFTKAISKSTAFLMIGATVIGSGAGATVYAKDINETCNVKVNTYKFSCNNIINLDCDFDNLWNPGNCIPGNGTSKPENKPSTPDNETSKPENKPSTPDNETSKPENKPSTPDNETSKPENKPSTPDNETSKPENKPSTPDNETSKPDTNVSTQTQFENRVLELVNVERQKAGLNALQMDESVRNVARLKSEDMRVNKYFDHTSPTYGSPFDMLKKFGISYKSAGENIAQGYSTPESVVNGWMNSSGHRANILNASFTHMGVGYDANGHYWTQMFIGK